MEQSAIKEAGNILSRRLHERAERLHGHDAAPLAAALAIDMSTPCSRTTYLQFGHDRDFVFCVESEFVQRPTETLRGFFLLLPDPASLKAILKAIRVA